MTLVHAVLRLNRTAVEEPGMSRRQLIAAILRLYEDTEDEAGARVAAHVLRSVDEDLAADLLVLLPHPGLLRRTLERLARAPTDGVESEDDARRRTIVRNWPPTGRDYQRSIAQALEGVVDPDPIRAPAVPRPQHCVTRRRRAGRAAGLPAGPSRRPVRDVAGRHCTGCTRGILTWGVVVCCAGTMPNSPPRGARPRWLPEEPPIHSKVCSVDLFFFGSGTRS